MDNVVSINHTKENTIEFDLTIEGLEGDSIDVRFHVEAEGMMLTFPCTKGSGNTWKVQIPELPMLKRTAYPYTIEVIADGYYFAPLKGSVNVVGSPDLYSTKPKNITLEPKQKKQSQESKSTTKETKDETKEKTSESSNIENIARRLMSEQNFSKKQIEEKVEEINESTKDLPAADAKHSQVMRILEEAGITTKGSRKKNRPKISFVTTKKFNS